MSCGRADLKSDTRHLLQARSAFQQKKKHLALTTRAYTSHVAGATRTTEITPGCKKEQRKRKLNETPSNCSRPIGRKGTHNRQTDRRATGCGELTDQRNRDGLKRWSEAATSMQYTAALHKYPGALPDHNTRSSSACICVLHDAENEHQTHTSTRPSGYSNKIKLRKREERRQLNTCDAIIAVWAQRHYSSYTTNRVTNYPSR